MSDEHQRFHFGEAGEGARDMEAKAAEGKGEVRRFAERLFDVHTDERAWRRGAVGEEKVARTLAKLPPGWAVVHDLTIGSRGANLDHLVVGPPGVFTLNTKNLTGKVTIYDRTVLHNGSRTHFLPAARREAEKVQKALSRALEREIPVRPVVVLAGPADLDRKGRPTDVAVVHRIALRRWLNKQPGTMDHRLVELIEGAARAASTWTPPRKERPAPAAPPPAPEATPSSPADADDATADPEALVLNRWKRFGHDRQYVNTADGESLGYLDKVSGEVHVDNELDRTRVEQALRAAGEL